jgi:hypothetical protein
VVGCISEARAQATGSSGDFRTGSSGDFRSDRTFGFDFFYKPEFTLLAEPWGQFGSAGVSIRGIHDPVTEFRSDRTFDCQPIGPEFCSGPALC